MKKTLKILVALAATVTAASAQSSVTAFGVVDLNGRWLDNNGVTQYSMSQDGLAPSRLGFRGVEAMGGRLKAGSWLEAPLDPDIGNAGVGLAFTRRSTVSLSNSWGEVRLGRDETATYYNTGHFDPFGDTGLGAAGNLTIKPPAVPAGGAYDTPLRAKNMVAYFAPPNLAGGGAAPNGDSQSAEFGVMHSFWAANRATHFIHLQEIPSAHFRNRRVPSAGIPPHVALPGPAAVRDTDLPGPRRRSSGRSA
jgi:hypothetical protein